MLLDEGHRIVVPRHEMADIQIGLEPLRHAEQLLETLNGGDLVRIVDHGVIMIRKIDPVLIGVGRQFWSDADRGLVGADDTGSQGFGLLEDCVNLFVGEIFGKVIT